MHLALVGLYEAKWSDEVHEEWITNLLKVRPHLTRAQLMRTRSLMDLHAEEVLVRGYEHLVPLLNLPDPNDRHVLAAAIHGRADRIVTSNLKDFPVEILARYDIAPQHPDEFVCGLIDGDPELVLVASETHRTSMKNPPQQVWEYLQMLELQGLIRSAAVLRALHDEPVL